MTLPIEHLPAVHHVEHSGIFILRNREVDYYEQYAYIDKV